MSRYSIWLFSIPSVFPVATAEEQLQHSPVAGNSAAVARAAARRSAANAGNVYTPLNTDLYHIAKIKLN